MKDFKNKKHQDVEIISYVDEYKHALKELNYAWLKQDFTIEPSDEASLTNPQEEIIDKGGIIYFARIQDQIVGCAALLKITDKIYEFGKMAVSTEAQGYGIGTKLLKHGIQLAKEMQLDKVILYSNTQLAPAIHLYKKYGFTETPLESGLYDRADIKMELAL